MHNNLKLLKLILLSSALIKIIAVIIFYENGLSDEWLVLFNNFNELKMYSYYTLNGQNIPSSYMPPLYFAFLYTSKILSFNLFNFIYLVYFFQIVISTLSVIAFNKICKHFFKANIVLVGTTCFAFFPLLIFSNALISSACIQVFLYLLFLNFSLEVIENKKKVNIISFSLICSACLLLRGEFLIIFILTLIFFLALCKNKIKFSLMLLFATLLIISPYLIRNFINTDKIHLVNVSGFALWKGNNHFSTVEGYYYTLHPDYREEWPNQPKFKNLYKNLDNLEINKSYEVMRDKVFYEEGKKNILQDKKKYFNLYLKKLMSYYFIDINSTLKNYYNPLHVVPILFFAIFALPGIVIGVFMKKNKKLFYLSIIMFSLIFLISVFFILPRYKISIISLQIVFSLLTIDYIYKKLKLK